MKKYALITALALACATISATTVSTDAATQEVKKAAEQLKKKGFGSRMLEFVKKHPLVTAAGIATVAHLGYNFRGVWVNDGAISDKSSNMMYYLGSFLTTSAALAYIAANHEIDTSKSSSPLKRQAWAIAWTVACGIVGIKKIPSIYSNVSKGLEIYMYRCGLTKDGWNKGYFEHNLNYSVLPEFKNAIIYAAAIHYLIMQLSDDEQDELVEADLA